MKSKDVFTKMVNLWRKTKTSKRLKYTAIAIAMLIIVCAVFMVYAATYSSILPRVYIEGTDVGSMSHDEALELIRQNYSGLVGDRALCLKCGDSEKTILLSELGIKVDHEETVANAFSVGRQKALLSKSLTLIKSFFVKTEIPLVIYADTDTFYSVVDELSAPYVIPVKNASYRLEGNTMIITKATPGMVVDRAKALELLFTAVTDRAVTEITITPEYAQSQNVDVDKFCQLLSDTPRDAYYKYENGTVTVVDDVPGVVVSKDAIANAFASEEIEVRVPVEVKPANKTTAQLNEMLFRDTLASYSSSFATSSADRAANVTLAASRINGYILMPGDVFSYDTAIGKRTAENGYRMAGVYVGNKTETGIGGGICQTSSTLYAAALYANLEIVTRTSHSLPVSYIPAGMDATIAEGYIDLKLRNNTSYPIKLVTRIEGRKLTCSILGVKTEGQTVEITNTITGYLSPKTVRTHDAAIPVGYKKVISKGSTGYTVASQRTVKMNGQVVNTEKLSNSVYRASDIEEQINPSDENTPSSSLAIYDENNPPQNETPSETDTPPVTDNPPTDTTVDVPTENPETPPSITPPTDSDDDITVTPVE